MTQLIELRFVRDTTLGPWHRLPDGSLERLPDELHHPLYSTVGIDREQGSMLPKTPAGLYFVTSAREAALAPDVSWTSSGFVVSSRFRSLLEKHGAQEVEFVPAKLELAGPGYPDGEFGRVDPPTGGELLDFWLMNSWHRLDIVDAERSDAEWDEVMFGPKRTIMLRGEEVPNRSIGRWRHLVLTRDPDSDPFFGIQWLPKQRFVSEALARDIEAAGLNVGLWTLDLDTYMAGHRYGTIWS